MGFPESAPSPVSARGIAVVACRVLEKEVEDEIAASPHVVRREYFDVGLHDRPGVLRERLEGAICRAEDDPAVEAIVLVYGLCGLALAGLVSRRRPVIVPRAHDCMTLFLGSKERYAAAMRREPGLYWYTPGWNREKRVPGPDREAKLRAEYTEKFGAEDAEALMELERETFAHHTCVAYTDLGMSGDAEQRRYAESCATALGWRFEDFPGDPALLHALLYGPWDAARFLVIAPGECIAHSPDDAIVKAVPAVASTGGAPAPTQ